MTRASVKAIDSPRPPDPPSTLSAQFFYFGRNKVQYTDFAWHVLKTEHFDIYYYPEMKDLAERGAFFAEDAYRALEVKFNHSLNTRVPLILYSSHLHFQQTNTTGGFIPKGGRRILRIPQRTRRHSFRWLTPTSSGT